MTTTLKADVRGLNLDKLAHWAFNNNYSVYSFGWINSETFVVYWEQESPTGDWQTGESYFEPEEAVAEFWD